jgi:hypothetical protein
VSEQKKNDGGPAFPIPSNVITKYGMSLRDWFAGQAMAAMVGSYRRTMRGNEDAQFDHDADVTHPLRDMILDRNRETGEYDGAAEIAEDAYIIADAMLKEREVQP